MPEHPLVRRFLVPALLVIALSGVALLALVGGGDDVVPIDQVVERLIPNQGDEVLAQNDVGIDLADGYTAELTINGVLIPENQLRVIDALNQIVFSPGQDKVITSLRGDQNCAVALYWQTSQGRPSARSISWCFTAA